MRSSLLLLVPWASSLVTSILDTLNHTSLSISQPHQPLDAARLDVCPGYDAVNVKMTTFSLEAGLNIRGEKGCGVYGPDLSTLKLRVKYETGEC